MGKWVGSCGGLGLLPGMPGTYASLAAAIIFYALCLEFGAEAHLVVRLVVLVLVLVVGAIGWVVYSSAQDYFKSPDPHQFVLDEVMGQWIVLLCVPVATHALSHTAAGFFLFRTLDVAKPYPIRQVERIPSYWGVALDDVVAAVYAAIGLWVVFALEQIVIGQDIMGEFT